MQLFPLQKIRNTQKGKTDNLCLTVQKVNNQLILLYKDEMYKDRIYKDLHLEHWKYL